MSIYIKRVEKEDLSPNIIALFKVLQKLLYYMEMAIKRNDIESIKEFKIIIDNTIKYTLEGKFTSDNLKKEEIVGIMFEKLYEYEKFERELKDQVLTT